MKETPPRSTVVARALAPLPPERAVMGWIFFAPTTGADVRGRGATCRGFCACPRWTAAAAGAAQLPSRPTVPRMMTAKTAARRITLARSPSAVDRRSLPIRAGIRAVCRAMGGLSGRCRPSGRARPRRGGPASGRFVQHRIAQHVRRVQRHFEPPHGSNRRQSAPRQRAGCRDLFARPESLEGVGSRFVVRLPVIESSAEPHAESSRDAA